ncbi:hypothetical protein GCM10028864_44510 [Microlunatus parietis]
MDDIELGDRLADLVLGGRGRGRGRAGVGRHPRLRCQGQAGSGGAATLAPWGAGTTGGCRNFSSPEGVNRLTSGVTLRLRRFSDNADCPAALSSPAEVAWPKTDPTMIIAAVLASLGGDVAGARKRAEQGTAAVHGSEG